MGKTTIKRISFTGDKKELTRRSKDSMELMVSTYAVVNYYDGWTTLGELRPWDAKGEDPEGLDDPNVPVVDWQKVAEGLMKDYIPNCQLAKPSGRPRVDHSDLLEAVQEMIDTGQARNAKHACRKLEVRGLFLENQDLYSAYKRAKKIKKGRNATE